MKTNIWSINSAHSEQQSRLLKRSIISVCHSHSCVNENYNESLDCFFFARCILSGTRIESISRSIGYCFFEELIKIKSSIQMIKMNIAQTRSHQSEEEKEDMTSLAFLIYSLEARIKRYSFNCYVSIKTTHSRKAYIKYADGLLRQKNSTD